MAMAEVAGSTTSIINATDLKVMIVNRPAYGMYKKPPAVTSKDSWNADLHELQNSDDSNLKELSESAIGANDRNLTFSKTNIVV